jgi:hypothetical protein
VHIHAYVHAERDSLTIYIILLYIIFTYLSQTRKQLFSNLSEASPFLYIELFYAQAADSKTLSIFLHEISRQLSSGYPH